MKTITKRNILMLAFMLFVGFVATAQKSNSDEKAQTSKETVMKTYLIEREIPGAGQFTAVDLKNISQKSCSVLKDLGPRIQWIHSYVTGNKIYCIYKAENPEIIREHAKKGGFPANSIVEIANVISPATAN